MFLTTLDSSNSPLSSQHTSTNMNLFKAAAVYYHHQELQQLFFFTGFLHVSVGHGKADKGADLGSEISDASSLLAMQERAAELQKAFCQQQGKKVKRNRLCWGKKRQ